MPEKDSVQSNPGWNAAEFFKDIPNRGVSPFPGMPHTHKGEIKDEKDFYCDCKDETPFCNNKTCKHRHRKYPTREQYRQEHGGEWAGDFWERIKPVMNAGVAGDWYLIKLAERKGNDTTTDLVCDLGFGKPPGDWRGK